MRNGPVQWRVWKYVNVTEDCWEWTGALSRDGYGKISDEATTRQAHRLVYEILMGPIPESLVIDHLCRNRRCVNPLHMEVVDALENTRRGVTARADGGVRMYCRSGHELTEANVYREPKRPAIRRCRKCKVLRYREKVQRLRETK